MACSGVEMENHIVLHVVVASFRSSFARYTFRLIQVIYCAVLGTSVAQT